MQLDDLRVFHSIVETGGFVKASQTLNLPKSTLSRRIKNIEAQLGVRLFNRNNRGTQITPQGERYYQKTKDLLLKLEAINEGMSPEKYESEGQLRIKIPSDIPHLVQLLLEFSHENPGIKLDIITNNSYLDLNSNRLDFSFEANELPPTRYIARHLGDFNLLAVCSPDYIKRHGRPRSFTELSNCNFILWRNPNGEVERQVRFGRKQIKLKGNLIMETTSQHLEAAIQGNGVALLPENIAEHHLNNGMLINLFPDREISRVPFHILYPSRDYVSPAARRFIEFVLQRIKQAISEKSNPEIIDPLNH